MKPAVSYRRFLCPGTQICWFGKFKALEVFFFSCTIFMPIIWKIVISAIWSLPRIPVLLNASSNSCRKLKSLNTCFGPMQYLNFWLFTCVWREGGFRLFLEWELVLPEDCHPIPDILKIFVPVSSLVSLSRSRYQHFLRIETANSRFTENCTPQKSKWITVDYTHLFMNLL